MKNTFSHRLLPFKTLAKNVLQQIFVIPAAAVYYKAYIRKNGVYSLIICGHIGDFLYTMGYADAFQKENGLEKLRIVSTEKFRGLADCYRKEGREYFAVSGTWLHLLCIANRYAAGQLLFYSFRDCLVVEPANGFVQGFAYAKYYSQLHLKNCICQGVLKLKPDSRFCLPQCVKQRPQKTEARGMVLLCPYAQATGYEGTGRLFRKLAGRLAEKQYPVGINAPDGQQLFPGAIVVTDGLKEIFENFSQYRAVIGIRSGLLDLAVFAGCTVSALYPPGYDLTGFYDLRQAAACVQKSGHLFQYELTGDPDRDLAAIMAGTGL